MTTNLHLWDSKINVPLSNEQLEAVLTDVLAPIYLEVTNMSAAFDELKAKITSLSGTASAVAGKLDEQTAKLAAQAAQIAELEAKLAAADSPESITAVTADVDSALQQLQQRIL